MAFPVIKWVPSPNFSSRGGVKVRCIVVHDCEGSYTGSISWFAMAKSQVSAHLILSEDGSEVTQMVAWANKAWHACNANPISEGIEAAGFASKGFAAVEWEALAELVAWRLHANNIPCQEATATNNWTGFTEHAKLGAWGGGHHDLTEDSNVWAAFVKRVNNAYNSGVMSTPSAVVASIPAAQQNFKPSETSRNDEVIGSIAWMQMRLNALGFKPILTVDGIEGASTEAALKQFQTDKGLTVDGILGPKTIAALSI